jgi:hypothetical protein
MNRTDILLAQLRTLEAEINAAGPFVLKLNQQKVTKENMSFSGGNGRIALQPCSDGYDISLSGKSLEAEMTPFMEHLCGRACDGFKQTNKSIGKADQPFWRVKDFQFVVQAVNYYAKTRK